MALGLKTWLGSAVLACGLVSLILVPAARVDPFERWQRFVTPSVRRAQELSRRTYEARWRLRPALEYLTLLERRDSALAVLRSRGSDLDGGPILLVDESLPEGVRDATESIVGRQWRFISQRPSDVAVVVSVRLDTMDVTLDVPRRLRLGVHQGYALPRDESKVCFSIINVGGRTARRMADWVRQPNQGDAALVGLLPTTAPELLGPCAYFAAFGMPGGAIASWLEAVNYGPAILPTWVRDPPYRDAAKEYRTRQMWPSEYRHVDLYPCASGQRSRCRSAVLTAVPDFYSFRYPIEFTTTRPRGVVNASRFAWETTHPLGLGVRSYLADLVADMGEDSFARFWTSGESVDTAFATAFGVPLEDWTMKWAQAQVGTPLRGPAVRRGAVFQAFLVATLFLGVGMVYGTKREVG